MPHQIPHENLFHLGMKGLIRNPEGKILLLKINREKLKKVDGWDGEIYWDIPGGRIQRGKTAEETIRQEIFEETGIPDIPSCSHCWTGLSNIRIPIYNIAGIDQVGLVLSVYFCDVEGTPNIVLSVEHTEAQWFPPREASELLAFKYPKEFTELVSQLGSEGLPKLVRDRVPDIITSDGRTPRFHEASDIEYVKELKRKLREELFEFDQEEKTEELIDTTPVALIFYPHLKTN